MTTPHSTYRIQLDPTQVDFDSLAALVPYLHRLGVTHLYLSPVTTSRPGSPHGYDVADHSRVNPELGGREGLELLAGAASAEGMGLVIDIVPNHMAIGRHNPWWTEVLRHGPTAPHAAHFDLFWEPDGTIPLPLLGQPYADAISDGELKPVWEDGRLGIAYYDNRFPIDPATYPLVLDGGRELERAADDVAEAQGAERVAAGEEVDRLVARMPLSRIDAALEAIGPDRLHHLLDRQHYRLAWWQLSRERLGHRRFFTITDLVGIRQEDPAVFTDTHALVADLVRSGVVDGLRVDHVDGLRDPEQYLRRLRALVGDDAYLVVEKILAPGEEVPAGWPIEGTTGYDYLGVSEALWVSPEGLDELGSTYRLATGQGLDFDDVVHDQQRFIIHERLGPETARFAGALEAIARDDRRARDVIPSVLTRAAVDVVAALPVYRTYVRPGSVSEADREAVRHALDRAERRAPELDPRVRDFLEEVLLLDNLETLDPSEADARIEFVAAIQQFTGAVMAKGVEDTAFYQYNVLISLNEVGSHPAPFPADPVGLFHDHNRRIAAGHPATMTTTSTHDTKRSEDVRARISALSEMPERWSEVVESWHVLNRRHRGSAEAGAVPTRSEELFVYQTLIGSWPLDGDLSGYADRIREHLVKAAREAKVHTAWLEPDPAHEEALTGFARGLIEDAEFADELERFARPLWRAGAVNSLAQVTLRLAAPGVPDIYRGCESWDLSLTDPDNRRPVDWKPLAAALDRPVDVDSWEDGRIKLFVTSGMLHLDPRGEYLPLAVEGDRADHVVTFARRQDDRWVVVSVPRLVVGLTGEDEWWPRTGWDSTVVLLPRSAPTRWSSVFTATDVGTNGTLELAPLFSTFPVTVLTSRQ